MIDAYLAPVTTAISAITAIVGGYIATKKWAIPKINAWLTQRRALNALLAEIGAGADLFGLLRAHWDAIELLRAKVGILARSSHLGLYICDASGWNVWVNEPLAEMFGMSPEEMHAHGWLSPIIDRETAHRHWVWAVQNNAPYNDTYQIEVDGEVHTIHTEAFRHLTPDGRTVLLYVGYAECVTAKYTPTKGRTP